MLRRISKRGVAAQIVLSDRVDGGGETRSAGTSPQLSDRLSLHNDAAMLSDARPSSMAPKPLFLSNSSDQAAPTGTREKRIAELLARAAPKKETGGNGTSETPTPPLTPKSTGLERGSSAPVVKPRALTLDMKTIAAAAAASLADDSETDDWSIASDTEESPIKEPPQPTTQPPSVTASPTPEQQENQSPRASPKPERRADSKKLQRSNSCTPRSPRLSLAAAAISALTPRTVSSEGKSERLRRNSYSAPATAEAPKNTFTRIIYYQAPLVVLSRPSVFLVPNSVVTEGMRAALAQAHCCEFGIGTNAAGDNENELKAGAINLVDNETVLRRKFAAQRKSRAAGERGALLAYLQTEAPEINLARTTITHEYIFKNII